MIGLAYGAAKLVDWRISRRDLEPGSVTRYRVLRRTIFVGIVFVGVLSALLVIPQVRAVAGGVLASSAVIGLVIGFASQRTIGNAVAGILIAVTQPLRLGDEVEVTGYEGRRRGDRPHLHLAAHARQRPVRRPEREARLGYDPQLDDSECRDARRGDRAGACRRGAPEAGRLAAGGGGRGVRERPDGRQGDDPRAALGLERGARQSASRATCASRSPSGWVTRRAPRHDDLDFVLAQRGRKKKRAGAHQAPPARGDRSSARSPSSSCSRSSRSGSAPVRRCRRAAT